MEETGFYRLIQDCLENRRAHRLENDFVFPDGTVGSFELRIQPVPEGAFILSIDISERRLAEAQVRHLARVYETLSQINQTIVRVGDRGRLCDAIAEVSVRVGGFQASWIGERFGDSFTTEAEAGDPALVPLLAAHPVIRQAAASSVVQTDRSPRSVVAVPFRFGSGRTGVLGLVSQGVDSFGSAAETRLLEEIGGDLTFALDKIETEALRQRWVRLRSSSSSGGTLADARR